MTAAKPKSYAPLWILIAITVLPFAAAWVAFLNPSLLGDMQTTNRGELVTPPRPLPTMTLQTLSGDAFNTRQYAGHWTLLTVGTTFIVVLLVVAMIGLSALLGERQRGRATGDPYESGMPVTGSARAPQAVPFYLVALLFVIFDLEVAFLFAWAVAARETGPPGFVGAVVFVVILAVGLLYEWRQGVLDWGRGGGRR